MKEGCCGGKTFNLLTQCCKDNNVKDFFEICVKVSYHGDPHGGHAWISAMNLNTNEYHTYGRWKDGSGQNTTENGGVSSSGVQIDLEKFKYEDQITGKRCKIVCDYQPHVNLGFSDLTNNCSTYAMEEFNRLPGEKISSREWLFCNSPRALQEYLDMLNRYPVAFPVIILPSPYSPYDSWPVVFLPN